MADGKPFISLRVGVLSRRLLANDLQITFRNCLRIHTPQSNGEFTEIPHSGVDVDDSKTSATVGEVGSRDFISDIARMLLVELECVDRPLLAVTYSF